MSYYLTSDKMLFQKLGTFRSRIEIRMTVLDFALLYFIFVFRVEDLAELEKITGSENSLVGKICIARYGKIFRGNKVHNCQTKGAKGINDDKSLFIRVRIVE